MTAAGAVLAIAGLLVAGVGLYPFVVYPWLLSRLRSAPPVAIGRPSVTVSLLFCAYNEEAALPAKLRNVEDLVRRTPGLEVLAYDDGSSDRTASLLEAHPIVRTVRGDRGGKARGMKTLAALATGDVLVVSDANVLLAPDAIERLRGYYADPGVGGVCGTLDYENADESATAAVGSGYWRLEERIKSEESRSGNVMGGDGSIMSVRRELYPAFPDTVLDDFTVTMEVVFRGRRLVKAPDVIAYERHVTRSAEEYRRKVRIASRAFHTHLHLRPRLRRMSRMDRFKYASHKLFRWWSGALLGTGVCLGLTGLALVSVPAAALVVAGLGGVWIAGASGRVRAAARAVDATGALIATVVGVSTALRGGTVVTWTPAQSR